MNENNRQKTALITGITSGIGQAIKLRLEADGWRVIGYSRQLPIDQDGYEVDLSVLDQVEPVATRAGEEYGPLDAFIHVAGVWHDQGDVLAGKKLHEFTTSQITKTMNVGVTSAMVLTARLLPFMAPDASLLYISGTFQDGGASWLPYYTSKRALEDFVVGLASDETTFKVYGVSPSSTATDAYKNFYPDTSDSAQAPMSVAKICTDLIAGTLPASSGTIVEVRDGLPGMGYHK
jgi:NAD(P)-dependent dehydrogenase (short-subunit alcohol dehydrogenase family)